MEIVCQVTPIAVLERKEKKGGRESERQRDIQTERESEGGRERERDKEIKENTNEQSLHLQEVTRTESE